MPDLMHLIYYHSWEAGYCHPNIQCRTTWFDIGTCGSNNFCYWRSTPKWDLKYSSSCSQVSIRQRMSIGKWMMTQAKHEGKESHHFLWLWPLLIPTDNPFILQESAIYPGKSNLCFSQQPTQKTSQNFIVQCLITSFETD